MELRLEKYCGQAAKLSRSQIKAALRQKRVTLNGSLPREGKKWIRPRMWSVWMGSRCAGSSTYT